MSDNFTAALLRGVNVFSLVLLSTPLSVWTSEGLHKKKAMEALIGVQRDVSQPLLSAARDNVNIKMSVMGLCFTICSVHSPGCVQVPSAWPITYMVSSTASEPPCHPHTSLARMTARVCLVSRQLQGWSGARRVVYLYQRCGSQRAFVRERECLLPQYIYL